MTVPTTSSRPRNNSIITLRKAVPADAEAIASLGVAVFTETFKESGCTQEQLQAYLDESYTVEAITATLTSPTKDTLVATTTNNNKINTNINNINNNDNNTDTKDGCGGEGEEEEGDRILGFALLNRATSEPCIRDGGYPRPIELQRLYVGLESHGQGIGKMLMGEAEGLARAMGFETVWLGVWEENVRAQGMYGKLGYQRVGEHVFDVGGDIQTDWILVKKL